MGREETRVEKERLDLTEITESLIREGKAWIREFLIMPTQPWLEVAIEAIDGCNGEDCGQLRFVKALLVAENLPVPEEEGE
jgi:hypothetical protein